MILLRCTQRLLKLSGIKPAEALPVPTAVLGEWYGNAVALPLRGRSVVLYVHHPSRLSVVVPGRSLRTTLPGFQDRTVALLRRLALPERWIEAQQHDMRQVCYARTADRRMLGSMNDLVVHIRFYAERAGSMERLDLDRLELELSEVPHGPLKYNRPRDVVREMFGARVGGQ